MLFSSVARPQSHGSREAATGQTVRQIKDTTDTTLAIDEVQVIGYGQTTKRFNTGSVVSISAKEIGQQPVTNVLSALSGRMPGVFVQTTNGLPGGNINIQIRGYGIDTGRYQSAVHHRRGAV